MKISILHVQWEEKSGKIQISHAGRINWILPAWEIWIFPDFSSHLCWETWGIQHFNFWLDLGEGELMIAFALYLLRQGYRPEQITVITMYTGQLLEVKRQVRGLLDGSIPFPLKADPARLSWLKPTLEKLGAIRVCAVDNFQGEENDIILLSLVRSNKDQQIGFLAEDNRICVALSRAKLGILWKIFRE